ncbi:unnamed protein product [Polarella glacialis]|uniref:C3H1-type domain-containing protein n=1 Tax=Polarella glacialis TaxID=89957 RepID=A0A813GY60_POLGL|nr:unnamed protein product [Polarella glacialis]CAE8743578.1 unnamed protein product [Polarella glacialis]
MLPNPGSMAHPELCRRPCIYFAAGSCANGSACGYCHLSHENRPSHLDRRHRDLLRKLSEAESLALLLPVLRCRAESTGLAAEAAEVLALEDKAVACGASSAASSDAASKAATAAATTPQHQLSKLSAALRKNALLHCAGDDPAWCDWLRAQARGGLGGYGRFFGSAVGGCT